MKLLITGGCGFLGSNLAADALQRGDELRLRDMVKMYVEITEQAVSINWGARPYRYREVMIPWNLGTWIDGWSPKIKPEEGLCQVSPTY